MDSEDGRVADQFEVCGFDFGSAPKFHQHDDSLALSLEEQGAVGPCMEFGTAAKSLSCPAMMALIRVVHDGNGRVEFALDLPHACKQRVHPLDEWLDLVGKSLTPDVECLLLEGSAEFGSRRSTKFPGSWAGVYMSRSRVDHEVCRRGRETVEFESQEVEEADEGPERSNISIDGTGVPVRKSELKGRKGKQEDGAAKTHEASDFRLCVVEQDEESGKVSMVHGSDTQSSKIDSVNGEKDREDAQSFDDRLRREAVRQGTLHTDEVVILSDGAPWTRNAAARVFSGMTIIFILDMFHALGWLSDALKTIYPTNSERIFHLKRMKAMLKSGQGA